ncbi:MAG: CsgG/HfaB family protein [Ferruginibacter sp.]
MKKLTLLMLCLAGCVLFSNAQRKKKDKEPEVVISLDTVTNQCQGIAQENKPRVTVPRFNVTSPRRPDGDFGPNLATMLTSFLQQVGCFRVLEQKNNMSDIDDEINQGDSRNADKSTSIERGKQLTANVIITGEVTRYEVASKTSNIMGVGNTKHTASIGIVIKIIDPRTREVLDVRNFSADKETSGGSSVSMGYLHFSNKNDQNPALEMAAQQVIKQAAIFVAQRKDIMPMSGKGAAGKKAEGTGTSNGSSTVIITNIEYEQLSALSGFIEKIKGVKTVNSDTYEDKKATIFINHSLKLKELVDKILTNTGVKLTVASMSKDVATLSVK